MKIYNRSGNLPLVWPWGPEVHEQVQLNAQVQEEAPPEMVAEVKQVQHRPWYSSSRMVAVKMKQNFYRDFTELCWTDHEVTAIVIFEAKAVMYHATSA